MLGTKAANPTFVMYKTTKPIEYRASLHEEFGRKLMKHAKVGMGREETGCVFNLILAANILIY